MDKANTKKNLNMPAIPLITCDPYFSLWSMTDTLYDSNTVHWTGNHKPVVGHACIDNVKYRFMGKAPGMGMNQVDVKVTPTASLYSFEKEGVCLTVHFRTPLLLDDLDLVSRPCSYIDFRLDSLDGKPHKVELELEFSQSFCCDGDAGQGILGGDLQTGTAKLAWMGKLRQAPLSHSGDNITIDWGYLYLAVSGNTPALVTYLPSYQNLKYMITVDVPSSGTKRASMVAAYDDIASIDYFGSLLPGYWARNGKSIVEVIEDALAEHDDLMSRCDEFDRQLMERTGAIGPGYERVCTAAYRQAIAAHKLIADKNGDPVFLSKECFSNGCVGTVDVTYPSTPLFFLYNPELVRAMMRPVQKFARLPVWEYDFAPHDVGRYPCACGQVYGLKSRPDPCKSQERRLANGDTYARFYLMPAGSNVYELSNQMPVEECGNMLILAAALIQTDMENSIGFIRENMDLYEKWVRYLIEYGADPLNQLCTDDFAGHLAHNVNLSFKAVMGIASYAILLTAVGRTDEADKLQGISREMASDVYRRAENGTHTRLTFDQPDSWSMKYNAVWDILFGTDLWPKEFFQKEVNWYKAKQNSYGVPLDSRKSYTKSDWMMWCASMSNDSNDVEYFAEALCRFLIETPDRVPFCDWFDTLDGKQCRFQNRSVQGGLFMPLLVRRYR